MVLPRVCLTGFTFAQPFLITRIVNFVIQPNTPLTDDIGWGLIGATALVYLGLAITTANNQHKTFRLITMLRGSLVSLIYRETLTLSTVAAQDSAAVTLMSADIERVGTGLRYMHEIWASPIDIGLALWLLERQLGVASVAPAAVFLRKYPFTSHLQRTVNSRAMGSLFLSRTQGRSQHGSSPKNVA